MDDEGVRSLGRVNVIRRRGDPKWAITLTGHRVEKTDYIFFRDENEKWRQVKCADYHGEHFVYLDPLWDKPEGKRNNIFACTCGSPAVIVGPGTAVGHETRARSRLLVCYIYTLTLTNYGVGQHATGHRPWA